MIKVERISVMNMENAIRGARNPMNSWARMDSFYNEKGEYEPYSVPADWRCRLAEEDMSKKVNCASCGKEERFGECYPSMEIHNVCGFGYAVCPECYQKEIERRLERARDKGEI